MSHDTEYDETWDAKLRDLSPGEQADMLAGALRLLQHPDAISTPLESEVHIFAEQVYLALGRILTA